MLPQSSTTVAKNKSWFFMNIANKGAKVAKEGHGAPAGFYFYAEVSILSQIMAKIIPNWAYGTELYMGGFLSGGFCGGPD